MLIAFLVVITLILIGAGVLGMIFWADSFILWLAKHDALWSPYRNKAPGGQFFVMAKGKADGEFAGIFHSIRGVVLDNNHNFVEDMSAWEAREKEKGYLEQELGVVWVGFFRKFYLAPVKYVAIDKIPKKTEFALVEKERKLTADEPYYYWQYLMAAHADAIEIQGNISVDMFFLFTLRIQNAYKALYVAGKFPVRATTAIERCARQFFSQMEFDNVREEHNSASGKNVVDEIHKLNDLPTDLRGEFGLELDNTEFLKFNLTPGDPEVAKSLTIKKVRENEALGILAIADAEATRLEKRYRAIDGMAGASAFALAEAIREAKPSTVVMGGAGVAVGAP